MGENSRIEWCDHTFNPWIGCTRISPGCDHCYAEAWARRSGLVQWDGPPRRTSDSTWRQPLKWDAEAKRAGVRRRVFCASLADVFDNQALTLWRDELWALIGRTPNLDWLLLTKRPQNIVGALPTPHVEALLDRDAPWPWPWPNVWLGVTAENQAEADRRIPSLLAVPAARRFVSCEPLLGAVDLHHLGGIDWVIAGGESGPGARPAHPDWFRSLRDQCAAAGVPFFLKQWGKWVPHRLAAGGDLRWDVRAGRVTVVYPTGQSDAEIALATDGGGTVPGTQYMHCVNKYPSGATLDGREHREVPATPLPPAADGHPDEAPRHE